MIEACHDVAFGDDEGNQLPLAECWVGHVRVIPTEDAVVDLPDEGGWSLKDGTPGELLHPVRMLGYWVEDDPRFFSAIEIGPSREQCLDPPYLPCQSAIDRSNTPEAVEYQYGSGVICQQFLIRRVRNEWFLAAALSRDDVVGLQYEGMILETTDVEGLLFDDMTQLPHYCPPDPNPQHPKLAPTASVNVGTLIVRRTGTTANGEGIFTVATNDITGPPTISVSDLSMANVVSRYPVDGADLVQGEPLLSVLEPPVPEFLTLARGRVVEIDGPCVTFEAREWAEYGNRFVIVFPHGTHRLPSGEVVVNGVAVDPARPWLIGGGPAQVREAAVNWAGEEALAGCPTDGLYWLAGDVERLCTDPEQAELLRC